MSKVINKKKTNINIFFKYSIFFFILFSFFLFYFINRYKFDNIFNSINNISKKYDYVLKNVKIEGLNRIKKEEINKYFNKYKDKSIFLIPIKKISNKIKENIWVEKVKIKNTYKNQIFVDILEIDPIGVYLSANNYILFSETGQNIDVAKSLDLNKYIIFAGENANKEASKIISIIPKNTSLKIIKAIYVNNRRWNLITKENLKIKLPEFEYNQAINDLINIYKNLNSTDLKNIEYIDLRIPEKAIIKLYE